MHWGKKGFQYIFTGLEFIHTHARALYFSRLRVQPSVKFLFSSRDVPRCVRGSANFLNDPLKHFSFSSLFHRLLLASLFRMFSCLRSPRSFSFAGERRRGMLPRTTVYFLLRPCFPHTLRKVSALATRTSVKTARARRRREAFSMPREQFR